MCYKQHDRAVCSVTAIQTCMRVCVLARACVRVFVLPDIESSLLFLFQLNKLVLCLGWKEQ